MITIPTGDLCGIIADCIPFALPGDDMPALNSIRLEWDGTQLHDDGRLKVDRTRATGHSALRMVIAGLLDIDGWPDIRQTLAGISTAADVRTVSYTPRMLADFGKVRPRGAMKLTFTGATKPTLVEIGERFVGAIQPVKEADDG